MFHTQTRFLPIAFSFAFSALSLAACNGGGSSIPPPQSPPVQDAPLDANATAAAPAAGADVGTFAQFRTATATYQNCPVFSAGNTYNAAVTTAAIDPNSARYIAGAIQAGNRGGFWASTGSWYVNIATNSTPLLAVHPRTSYNKFPLLYPWSRSFRIQPGGDAHAIVLQRDTCHLYESYATAYNGSLYAYSGANWNLRAAFVPLPGGRASAMSSGLSLFAGMVKWEELQTGAVNHALNFEAPQHTVGNATYVYPADDGEVYAFKGTSGYQLPYGARLRLKASFNITSFTPEAKIVAQAMKTYGIYLSDTGSWDNGLYFANAVNGSNPWNMKDLSALGRITIADFDVLKLPTIYRR